MPLSSMKGKCMVLVNGLGTVREFLKRKLVEEWFSVCGNGHQLVLMYNSTYSRVLLLLHCYCCSYLLLQYREEMRVQAEYLSAQKITSHTKILVINQT